MGNRPHRTDCYHFFAHHLTSPTLSIVQNFLSIDQGVTVWRGSKNRMFPYESGVVHNTALHYRAFCDLKDTVFLTLWCRFQFYELPDAVTVLNLYTCSFTVSSSMQVLCKLFERLLIAITWNFSTKSLPINIEVRIPKNY
jgi:hypothetical protein